MNDAFRRLGRLGIVAALALVVAACGQPDGKNERLADSMYSSVEGASKGEVVDVSAALSGDWDRVVLLEGSHTESDVAAALGFEWPGYRFGMTGEGELILLIADGAVQQWTYLPEVGDASAGRLLGIEFVENYWADLDPERPAVEVLEIQDDGPIVVCPGLCEG